MLLSPLDAVLSIQVTFFFVAEGRRFSASEIIFETRSLCTDVFRLLKSYRWINRVALRLHELVVPVSVDKDSVEVNENVFRVPRELVFKPLVQVNGTAG